jgi:UDP-glucose 4-epimerase
MKIGVIGGSGFIGSHVVDKLIYAGHEVTIFDIMKPHRSDVNFINLDITDLSKCVVALTGNYDVLYILAAMANVNDVYKNPCEAVQLNVQGVANILEAARRNGVGRIIFASTVWVYSHSDAEMIDETTPLKVDRADHVYTSSKIAAELLVQSYAKLYGLDFTILRYGIPYGPRARGGTILAVYVKKAINGEPLTIFGDGSSYRRFLYVEDLAEANVAALQSKARNQIYNLEGSTPVTVKEVADVVVKHFKNVGIEYKDTRPGDFSGKNISSEKAQRELGWYPKTEFDEGVRKYIEWYRSAIQK